MHSVPNICQLVPMADFQQIDHRIRFLWHTVQPHPQLTDRKVLPFSIFIYFADCQGNNYTTEHQLIAVNPRILLDVFPGMTITNGIKLTNQFTSTYQLRFVEGSSIPHNASFAGCNDGTEHHPSVTLSKTTGVFLASWYRVRHAYISVPLTLKATTSGQKRSPSELPAAQKLSKRFLRLSSTITSPPLFLVLSNA